jgi:SAM-dependent methyltransferase
MNALWLLKGLVPTPWRPRLRAAYTRIAHAGWHRRCNICGARLRGFLAHGIPPEPDFLCPLCRSKPPHRLSSTYFDQHPELFRRGGILLHVAPEPGLGRKLREAASRHAMTYRCGSITGNGHSFIDLRHLPFDAGTVDLVYCCHVLNAMSEDRQAMAELRRVLAPGGVALLQVPAFGTGPNTVETSGAAERMQEFGDEGIYRRYTNADYRARLEAAGFAVEEFRAESLPGPDRERHQLKQEHVHVCRPA